MTELCSDLSRDAGEPLGATAVTAERWLLLEVPGAWPRDVADPGLHPEEARKALANWIGAQPRSRLQFIRRPGREPDRPLAFVVHSEEKRAEIRRIELESYGDLSRLDLDAAGEVVDGSLVLVCGHGSRDRCCALRGTAVFGELAKRLGDEGLWISSHQGGHRFAANVLVLPAGIQLGRVEPAEAPLLVARALAGRIELDRYRGRTCYEGPVQAAELAVRREAGLDGTAEVALEAVEDGIVTLQAWDGEAYEVAVEEHAGPAVPASCGAAAEPQPVFVIASLARIRRVTPAGDTRDP